MEQTTPTSKAMPSYRMDSRMNDIQVEYNRIQKNLDKWSGKLKALQETCLHTDATVVFACNTGNYDPSSDCYWKTSTGPDCRKIWREDIE